MLFTLIDKLLDPFSPVPQATSLQARGETDCDWGGVSASQRLMSHYYDNVLSRRTSLRDQEKSC